MDWDKTKIAEGVSAPDLNDEIRANWAALEAALTKEMNFSTGGTASLQGILKQGGARAFFQDTAPATRLDGSAFASTDLGLLWFDSNSTIDNQFNVLTATTPTWTPVSTEIIAVAVAAAHTWADVQTFTLAAVFSLPPTFTLGAAANDAYLTGTDAAGTATVNLIKAGTNDLATLPDSAEMASNAAPVEDEAIANKKYVDDSRTNPGLAGGWVNFDGRSSNGACTVNDSYNVTGVARTAAGRFTITWDNNFSGANYAVVGSTRGTAGGTPVILIPINPQAGTVTLATILATVVPSDQDLDGRSIHVAAFGQ